MYVCACVCLWDDMGKVEEGWLVRVMGLNREGRQKRVVPENPDLNFTRALHSLPLRFLLLRFLGLECLVKF